MASLRIKDEQSGSERELEVGLGSQICSMGLAHPQVFSPNILQENCLFKCELIKNDLTTLKLLVSR